MNKNKLIYLVVFIISFLSLFFVKGINAYFTKKTETLINQFSIQKNTSYTVVHEVMDLNGNYVEHHRDAYSNVPIGTVVSPDLLSPTDLPREGFDLPQTQTVNLNSFTDTVITYRYPRKQFTLTINNSNYVTTNKPSGTYYYGTEIHLVADETNNNGNPFIKWSNNKTNRDYTFLLTKNTTIKPIYAESYTITYVPNNGSSSFTEEVIQNEPITTFPDVEYNDCNEGTGSHKERECTYVYKLLGWYTDSNFTNKIDETFVPTENTTLYAKWNKIYYRNDGPVVFDGDDIIYTDVLLYNKENAKKDFIVTFTVDEYLGYNPTNNKDKRATIFQDMNENDPYLGVQFFHDDNNYYVNVNSSKNAADKVKDPNTGYVTGQKVIFKRENGIVYYSYDEGDTFTPTVNFSNFTAYFDIPATFGGGLDANQNPWRYFIGTLSDMSVEIIEPPTYTIHYDANGGTGTMDDQIIEIGNNSSLTTNTFTKENAVFGGWNTEPDGTGTSYPDNYAITSDLGNADDVITLYAQWIEPPHYFVHFDSNGGTGTMSNQEFIYDTPAEPLTTNTFTRTNYVFRGWNTESDGSGTHYDDEEEVRNLSNIDDDIITLYAEWWKIEYSHEGDAVFNGTQSTFIDTGVNIFSSENINKDFEIRFTFKSVDSDQLNFVSGNPKQPTIFNAKDESNSNYPGLNIRFNSSINTLYPTYRWGGGTTNIPKNGISVSNAPIEFILRRKSDDNNQKIITIEYKYNGFDSGEETTIKQSSWNLNQSFATNVAFGGYFDGSNQPGRFFKGTLADMIILMEE